MRLYSLMTTVGTRAADAPATRAVLASARSMAPWRGPALRPLLAGLDLAGVVVTADAL
jgi:hypothetical protein